jgi:hypothetical protein
MCRDQRRWAISDVSNGSWVASIAGPTGMRNFTGDEGRPFEVGDQVPVSSHRKLLPSKAMVVSVAEKPEQVRRSKQQRYFRSSLRLLTPRSDYCRLVLAPSKPYCHPTPGAIGYDRRGRQQKRLIKQKAAGMTS